MKLPGVQTCPLPISVYDKAAADYAVTFIESLKHTKGTWSGKLFELIDWQEQIIRDVFGTLKPNGYRQFNTAYVEIPKKMGKQLALDTLIPTPAGYTTMGEIKVGDRVFTETGSPAPSLRKVKWIIRSKHTALPLKMENALRQGSVTNGWGRLLVESEDAAP